MTTIRLVRRRRFTTIDRGIVTDERISLKAKGLMLWLLDKPDDWQVRSEDIARIGPDGRDSVRSGLQELEKAGYIVRKKERLPDGTITSVCCVYESPGQTGDGKSGAGETDVGSPDAGEPGPLMKTDTEDCDRRETSSLAVAVRSDIQVAVVVPKAQRDTVYNALALGCGFELDEMTKDAKKVTALASNDLIAMGVTDPTEIARRCFAYRVKFPNAACTPKAVVKHWPGLRPELVEAEQQHRSQMASPKKETAAERITRLRNERGQR